MSFAGKNIISTFITVLFMSSSILAQSGSLAYNNHPESTLTLKQKEEIITPLSMSAYNLSGLDYDPFKTEIDYGTLAGVGAVTIVAGIGVHIYQHNAWWKDQRRDFHFHFDWDYALWMDKIGHLYAGALLAHLFSAGLEAGNIQSEPAAIYGSAMAFLYHTYVEVQDGFGPDWGFSPIDVAANALGASFTLAQYYYPFLKNFQFKFSYYPSQKLRFGIRQGIGIDDYEGQKYWLSMRVNNFLPKDAEEIWPDFLNIAVGMSVRDLDGRGGGLNEYYIALDLDAEYLPLYGPVWQFIKNSLNYIHFPMPGVRITPDAAFFVFVF